MKKHPIHNHYSRKIIDLRLEIRRKAEHLVLLTLRDSEKIIWRYHLNGYTIQMIADELGKYYRSIHRTIRRIEEKMDTREQNLSKNSDHLKFYYDVRNKFEGDTV